MTRDNHDETYRIVRHFQDDRYPRETIREGLTLAEAQEHCNGFESSSSTATDPENVQLLKDRGPWFDGFYEE